MNGITADRAMEWLEDQIASGKWEIWLWAADGVVHFMRGPGRIYEGPTLLVALKAAMESDEFAGG